MNILFTLCAFMGFYALLLSIVAGLTWIVMTSTRFAMKMTAFFATFYRFVNL